MLVRHLEPARPLVEELPIRPFVRTERRSAWRTRVAVVVGLAAVVAVAVVGFDFLRPPEWQRYGTEVGEHHAFPQSDGSILNLNTQTEVAVRITPSAREVQLLAGEATFEVKHEDARPFLVHAGNTLGAVRTLSETDRLNALGWQQGRLVFRQTEMGEVAREFNRCNKLQLRIVGRAAERRTSGLFDKDSPESFADLLSIDGSLQVERAGDVITIQERER